MSEKGAISLISDVDKSSYNEGAYYQIAPLMFKKINEKISGKNGTERALLLFLIFQEQNGTFNPSEKYILKECNIVHSAYVNAREKLKEEGLIDYIPFKYIKINYKKLME